MADIQFPAIYDAGAVLGAKLEETAKNLYSLSLAKIKLDQERELHNINMKTAKLNLDALEITHGPEAVQQIKQIQDKEFKVKSAQLDFNAALISDMKKIQGGEHSAALTQLNAKREAVEEMGYDFEAALKGEIKPVDVKKSLENAIASGRATDEQRQRYNDLLTTPREQRLQKGQQLTDFKNDLDFLYKRGGTIDQPRINEISKNVGADITPELEAGRGEPSIDRNTGQKKWRVLSDPEWNAKVTQGIFSQDERQTLETIKDEYRGWSRVKGIADKLGINENNIGNMKFEDVMTPIGPLSIPAKFELIGQYSQDPKYTALKREIETTFQAFRKRVTGAQAGEKELVYLRNIMPSLKDNPKVFFATINNLMDGSKQAFNDKIDMYQRFGRDTSKFKDYFDEINAPVQPAGQGGGQGGGNKYSVGQIITGKNGKQYKITGGNLNDPDVEEVKK
jgi:hypothetical protein